MVSSQTAWEQDAERGKKYYNSAVTREMSNAGHMGLTAKGLRGNGHREEPRGDVCPNVIMMGNVIELVQGWDFFLAPDRWTCLPGVESCRVGIFGGRGGWCFFCWSLSLSVCPGRPD